MRKYNKPFIATINVQSALPIATSRWNDVGNFGFGDDEDDDREGDDNWDKDWSWGD